MGNHFLQFQFSCDDQPFYLFVASFSRWFVPSLLVPRLHGEPHSYTLFITKVLNQLYLHIILVAEVNTSPDRVLDQLGKVIFSMTSKRKLK